MNRYPNWYRIFRFDIRYNKKFDINITKLCVVYILCWCCLQPRALRMRRLRPVFCAFWWPQPPRPRSTFYIHRRRRLLTTADVSKPNDQLLAYLRIHLVITPINCRYHNTSSRWTAAFGPIRSVYLPNYWNCFRKCCASTLQIQSSTSFTVIAFCVIKLNIILQHFSSDPSMFRRCRPSTDIRVLGWFLKRLLTACALMFRTIYCSGK